MRTRDFRRHQLAKKKRDAKQIYPHDEHATSANHLAMCSCYMCGNPRKWWNSKTRQEIIADLAFVDQLEESSVSKSE